MKDAACMTREAWEDLKAESVAKMWHKTLLNRVDQLSGTVASSATEMPEESLNANQRMLL